MAVQVWNIALYASMRLMSQYTPTWVCSIRLSFVWKSSGKYTAPYALPLPMHSFASARLLHLTATFVSGEASSILVNSRLVWLCDMSTTATGTSLVTSLLYIHEYSSG